LKKKKVRKNNLIKSRRFETFEKIHCKLSEKKQRIVAKTKNAQVLIKTSNWALLLLFPLTADQQLLKTAMSI